MIFVSSREVGEACRHEVVTYGRGFFKSEWLETGTDEHVSPTVTLAEQPPHSVLEPHFHRRNQFQLFPWPGGKFGREDIEPFLIHYAGAYTGYGPIVAGDEPLRYFTIRAAYDNGLIPSSQARERMPRGPKRQETCHYHPWPAGDLTSKISTPQRETLLPFSEGLGVEVVRLPAGGTLQTSTIEDSAGQYVFVTTGTVQIKSTGHQLGQHESAYAPKNESAQITAGTMGAEVLLLHMPELAQIYRGAPVEKFVVA